MLNVDKNIEKSIEAFIYRTYLLAYNNSKPFQIDLFVGKPTDLGQSSFS